MQKKIKIEGMACAHCAASVENALKSVTGVQSAQVCLEDKCAVVTLNEAVADSVLTGAVTEIGFEVLGIE